MTISQIYTKYKIMPTLQLHMLRVAAVAKLICENMNTDVDTDAVIKACLLHDMGNIIKFKLGFIPEALEPEGLDYWQGVKDEYIKKYGDDEHNATFEIAKEIGVSERVFELISSIGFSKSQIMSSQNDFAKKIACYADHRVGPEGVLSLEERMSEGRKRFEVNKNISEDEREKYRQNFESYSEGMMELEKQIFEKCKITPEYVNDTSINDMIETMRNVEIDEY